MRMSSGSRRPSTSSGSLASSSHQPSTSSSSLTGSSQRPGDSRAPCIVEDKTEESRIFSVFICPITHEIMHDPVVLVASNQTVNRAAAQRWFGLGNTRCPVTGIILSKSQMISNRALQAAMKECDLGISARFPRAFVCPVTDTIMRDPVLIVGSEQTISRTAYNRWRASNNSSVCPVTKKRLANTSCCENIALRKALEEWEEEHGVAPYEVYGVDHMLPSLRAPLKQVQNIHNEDCKNPNISKGLICFHCCLLILYLALFIMITVALATSSLTDTKIILNSSDMSPEKQLINASKHGDVTEIEKLISAGSSVDLQDDEGRSLLFLATAGKHTNAVKLLIKLGADTETLTHSGETPMLRAVRLNSLVLVSVLVHGGALINGANSRGITPLTLSVYHDLIRICNLLLVKGANTEVVDSSGWTPLVWASYKNHRDAVQVLIEEGARANYQTPNKYNNIPVLSTPLHIAARQGFFEVAKALIASSPNLKDMEDIEGKTPKNVICSNCASSKLLLDLLA